MNFLKILLFSFVFLFLCSCNNYEDEQTYMEIWILTEVFFLEQEFGKERCDNFLFDKEIMNVLKEKRSDLTLEALESAHKKRLERTNSYVR